MENNLTLLPRHALRDFYEPKLHARPDLVEPHRSTLALLVVPAQIVVCQVDRGLVPVARRARCVRRRALVPIRPRPALSALPEQKVCDVFLVSEIQHAAWLRWYDRISVCACGTLRSGGRALEHAPDALRYAVRFYGDHVVPEVKRTALGVVCDEHDATRRGEREGFGGERREKRLEGLHEQRKMGRNAGARCREGCEHELCV